MRWAAIYVILVISLAAFAFNAYKLVRCDFKSDYKCEAIHGAGFVIPPLSWLTVWAGTDSDKRYGA